MATLKMYKYFSKKLSLHQKLLVQIFPHISAAFLLLSCSTVLPAFAVSTDTTSATFKSKAKSFHLEEATIDDVHRALKSGQLTATALVQMYLKRIDAYNGRCVAGEIDPTTGLQLGDISPIANS